MRSLALSERARSDLKGICQYSFRFWGAKQATRYLLNLEHSLRELARRPESGLERERLRIGFWSKRVRQHVIFYTFSDQELRVHRVLHGAMDSDLHL
ncbi:MAG: type II toxin-antitoxin system RelE/ParE family toxin [Planctomycetota bacterium]|jgi:toxin ParE1/3/4